MRALPEDYPVDDAGSDVTPLMFNAVGGSTVHWTAHAPRFHPSDFRVRSQDGVADDWPLIYVDLEPYYDLNDQWMGCSGIAGDPANPPRAPRPVPSAAARAGRRAAGARLRQPRLALVAVGPYDHFGALPRAGGLQQLRSLLGCTVQAKASTDVTYWPAAIANGVELRTGARVFEVTTDRPDGPRARATSTPMATSSSSRRAWWSLPPTGSARRACCCFRRASAIPEGLANSSGLVDRNLMFHPCAASPAFSPMASIRRTAVPWQLLLSQEFYETDERARLRARLHLPDEPQHRPGADGDGLRHGPGRLGRA